MRSIITTLFLLLTTIFAALVDIQTAVKSITKALDELDASVTSVSAAADAKSVGPKVIALSDAVKSATKTFSSSSALTLFDTVQLQSPLTQLVSSAHAALENLAAKASLVKEGGQANTTLTALQDERAALQQLSPALVAKVPTVVQSLAKAKVDEISKLIDAAIKSYSS